MPTTQTTLLLDADIIAYKLAAMAQKEVTFDGDEYLIVVDPLEAVYNSVTEYITDLCDTLSTTNVIVCLSSPSKENWRKLVLPSYKANRLDVIPPVMLKSIKEYMAATYPTYQRPTLEADDVMGILSTSNIFEGKKIIVSEDKDMQTIPGWLFNPRKDQEPRYVTVEEADRFHLYQSLVGDSTDNYKGCPKVGPVGANKLLDEDCSWDAVVWQYHCKGFTEEDALVQARVARICRNTDYDFRKKEVILWTPER